MEEWTTKTSGRTDDRSLHFADFVEEITLTVPGKGKLCDA